MAARDEDMDESVARGSVACPEPGLYRHYKGADYRVLGCVRHSETDEWLVLYRALYGERGLWVRPLAMFVDAVETGGRSRARFARIESVRPEEPAAERPTEGYPLDG